MNKTQIGLTRAKVLEEWKRNPYRTVREIAGVMGLSLGSISSHLCALEREGKIERKKLTRSYSGHAPGDSSRDWNVASASGVVIRKQTKARVETSVKRSREQELIDKVVAKALANGTAWTGGTVVKLDSLSGCKVG